MPLSLGTRLGAYEIVAPLGTGGMGVVYRARDLRLGREIALKVLPAGMSASADWLARFEREARVVAALSHPNIVMLHTFEDEGGVRFLTMELVEGQSLDQALTPGGFPIPRVLDLGIALADALTAAHEKGVIHRDLKPANAGRGGPSVRVARSSLRAAGPRAHRHEAHAEPAPPPQRSAMGHALEEDRTRGLRVTTTAADRTGSRYRTSSSEAIAPGRARGTEAYHAASRRPPTEDTAFRGRRR